MSHLSFYPRVRTCHANGRSSCAGQSYRVCGLSSNTTICPQVMMEGGSRPIFRSRCQSLQQTGSNHTHRKTVEDPWVQLGGPPTYVITAHASPGCVRSRQVWHFVSGEAWWTLVRYKQFLRLKKKKSFRRHDQNFVYCRKAESYFSFFPLKEYCWNLKQL